MTTIDLNSDLGESYGSWVMGNDVAVLDLVSSANIACGFHAGDATVLFKTVPSVPGLCTWYIGSPIIGT